MHGVQSIFDKKCHKLALSQYHRCYMAFKTQFKDIWSKNNIFIWNIKNKSFFSKSFWKDRFYYHIFTYIVSFTDKLITKLFYGFQTFFIYNIVQYLIHLFNLSSKILVCFLTKLFYYTIAVSLTMRLDACLFYFYFFPFVKKTKNLCKTWESVLSFDNHLNVLHQFYRLRYLKSKCFSGQRLSTKIDKDLVGFFFKKCDINNTFAAILDFAYLSLSFDAIFLFQITLYKRFCIVFSIP